MSTRTRVRALALIALIPLALSGCAGANGTAAPSLEGEPVKFMTVASVGSPLQNYPDIEAGARAAVMAINADGGINGQPIEWEFCNTQADATRSSECYRKAIDEGFVALVGGTDTFSGASADAIESAGLPEIGKSSTGAESDWTSESSFPLHSGSIGMYSALPYAFAESGREKFAIVALDIPVVIEQSEYVLAAAEDAGLDTAGIVKVPTAGVTSYSPYVQTLSDEGVDAAVMILGPTAIAGVLEAADAVGLDAYFGTQYLSFGVSEAAALSTGIAEKVFVGFPYPSPNDVSVDGVALYNEELTAAGVGDDPVLRRGGGFNAWLAVHAAADVARTIEDDVTRESILAALNASSGIDLAGVATWNPSETADAANGSFTRFPAADFNVLTFTGSGRDVELVTSDLGPVEDPLRASR